MPSSFKVPVSTLIVVHDPGLQVLLLERADFRDHWQSVTGSQEPGESLPATAARELLEETGIDAAQHGGIANWHLCNVYEIYAQWRHRYAPDTTHNMEHVFGLQVPGPVPVRLAADEHVSFRWLPWREAAERCFSWSNREAILWLPCRMGNTSPEGRT